MRADYLMLTRCAQRRLRAAQARLATRHAQWQSELARCRELREEIALVQQIAGMDNLPGLSLDRASLFACLRKQAINRRRSEELCLQLRQQEECAASSERAWNAQRLHCQQLQMRLDARSRMLHRTQRQQARRRQDVEEAELQDRKTWNK